MSLNLSHKKSSIIITVSIYIFTFSSFWMASYRLLRELPQTQNQLYSLFYVEDNQGNIFSAKIFSIVKLQQQGLDEALQYNEEVLSDLDGYPFPENINKIVESIPNDGLFTFIAEPYQTNLQTYMRTNRITEVEALKIFDDVLKAIYSIYSNGYWHKSIRPENFVKIGNVWKLDSLVYSEDISKSKKLRSEYVWNPEYQPPEAYERDIHTFNDQEFLPIVVWNLGSLLLDLFFSVHKLKNHEILKCYKGSKFSLESIRVKKTDLFSKKLKQVLACMLHYDPKQRMKIEQVFANEFLSKQVSLLFMKKHKNSLTGAPIKIFTGGKSALSSALLSKQERDKGSKLLPINQMVKSAIQNLQGGISKLHANRQIKSLNQIQTDEDSGGKPSVASIFDKFLGKKSERIENMKSKDLLPQSIDQLMQSKELCNVIKKYKTIYDKSELLTIAAQKFDQIDYRDQQKEINLVSKYAVSILSYINLKQIVNNMQKKVNFMGININSFQKFLDSSQYQAFKKITNSRLDQKEKAVSKIRDEIKSLKPSERKIVDESVIRDFIEIDYQTASFTQIKLPYRKILKISYDILTKQYNRSSENQKLARLAMYIVYCLTIDKLYIQNMIERNFLPYFQWAKEQPSSYIPIRSLQRYIEQASIKVLVFHAKEVLERFFKL